MIQDSPISAVVLTLNEIRNIDACINGLRLVAKEILVVDSGSQDGTVERAQDLGARVVYNKFSSHAEQWAFALNQEISGEWVLALDADHRVTPELATSLLSLARSADRGVEGIYVNRLHLFRGTPMRHGGLFPKWMLKVFRRGAGFTDVRELLDFRFYVHGRTVKASGLLLEVNLNEREIAFWIEKHNRFSTTQAKEEFSRLRNRGTGWATKPRLLGSPDARVLWLKALWYRMPRYSRSVLYFFYRYFLRFGFLDGRQGFVFHVMQAFWYRLLVDIKLEEMLADEKVGEAGIAKSSKGQAAQRS